MTKFYPLIVEEIVQETADCVSVKLKLDEQTRSLFTFKPGQYITLRKELSGEDVRRSYSICSAPIDEELRVAIKQVEGGVF